MTRVHVLLLSAALISSGCLKLPEPPAPVPAPAPPAVEIPDPDADVIVGLPKIEI